MVDVIAEWGKTEEQRILLNNKGCKIFRGCWLGKPIPIQQFEESLIQ